MRFLYLLLLTPICWGATVLPRFLPLGDLSDPQAAALGGGAGLLFILTFGTLLLWLLRKSGSQL